MQKERDLAFNERDLAFNARDHVLSELEKLKTYRGLNRDTIIHPPVTYPNKELSAENLKLQEGLNLKKMKYSKFNIEYITNSKYYTNNTYRNS